MRICKRFENLMPLYFSNGLSASERKLVANHLAECPACLQYSHGIQNLLNDLKPGAISVDPNYGAELVVNIQNRLQKKRRQQKLMYYLVPAFSSIILMIIVGLNLLSRNSLSSQWLKNSTSVDLYVDLTHSGYFAETPEIAFDQINTSENDQITEELWQRIRTEMIENSGPVPVDDYIEATTHLTDQEFDSFLREIENYTL